MTSLARVTAIAVLVVGCGKGGDGDSNPGGDDDDGSGPGGPTAPGGECIGDAVECYKIGTVSSCFEQAGCYDVTDECGGAQVECDEVTDQGEDACLGHLGCYWIAEDGTEVHRPTGTCTGTAKPCTEFTDEAGCSAEGGVSGYDACEWDSDEMMCGRDYSVSAECSSWNMTVMFPDEAERGCSGRTGCTWVLDP